MRRYPMRLLIPALIAFLFLVPALATARPHREDSGFSASERPAVGPADLLSKIRKFLSVVWEETGSILEPDGASAPGAGVKPNAAGTGDTGSGLEPDGHH